MAEKKVEPQETNGGSEYAAAAQAVVDRTLARYLIEYGKRKKDEEAIALGNRILASLHVKDINTAAKKKPDQEVVKQASGFMRKSTLKEMKAEAEKAKKEAQASGRPAANRWVLRLNKGEDKQLSPRPRFPGQVDAFISAYTESGEARLGITVRREDHETVLRRFAGQGFWWTGKIAAAWEIRVFNTSGPDGLLVTVKTSPTV